MWIGKMQTEHHASAVQTLIKHTMEAKPVTMQLRVNDKDAQVVPNNSHAIFPNKLPL